VPDVPPADYFAVVFGHRYRSALVSGDADLSRPADAPVPGRIPPLEDVPPLGEFPPLGDAPLFEDGPSVLPPAQLRGEPGTRAPHVQLLRDDARISSIDLYGKDFVLLAGAEGGGWADAATALAGRGEAPLRAYRIGVDLLDPDGRWAGAHGATPAGAVLVRPDGVVAWRARAAAGACAVTTLAAALSRALARSIGAQAVVDRS
jgi:hypothetical protein